jgi:hypothetical protein
MLKTNVTEMYIVVSSKDRIQISRYQYLVIAEDYARDLTVDTNEPHEVWLERVTTTYIQQSKFK